MQTLMSEMISAYVVSVKKTFTYKGRVDRRSYIFVNVAFMLLFVAATGLDALIYRLTDGGTAAVIGLVLMLLHVPTLMSLGVRRLHDIGRSGWWMLIYFLPFVGIIILMFMHLMPTSPKGDRFETKDVISNQERVVI